MVAIPVSKLMDGTGTSLSDAPCMVMEPERLSCYSKPAFKGKQRNVRSPLALCIR